MTLGLRPLDRPVTRSRRASARRKPAGLEASSYVLLCALFATAACGGRSAGEAPPPPPQVAIAHTFAIAGSENAGPSLAARGSRAVVAWAATREGQTDVYAAVSDDGGAVFGAPVRVNDVPGDAHVSGEQPPRVAVGGTDIVVVWVSRVENESRIRLSRSADGGRSFEPAVTLHREGLTGARGWESVAIDAAGRTHALWLDGRRAAPTASGHQHAHADASASMPMKPATMKTSPVQDIVEATWSPDGRQTETTVASDVCFCCKTAMAIGADATVYAAWRHIYPNSMRDIAVARSTGQGFSPPVRVSVDNWQLDGCPDDGPAMVVDAGSILHIVWPTRVEGPTPQKGVFYAFSADRGRTFSPRVRLDDVTVGNASHPQIALDGAEVVAAWDEVAGGVRSVRARRIAPASVGAAAPVLSRTMAVGGTDPASYPVVGSTVAGVLVAWTAGKGETTIHLERLRR